MTGKLTSRELCLHAMLGALLFALKMVFAALPNIHPVAVLIIAGTLCFSWRMLYSVGVYVLLEGMVYGFGLWWLSYLYIWPLLVALTLLFRREDRLFFTLLAGAFGLCFGALCAVPYLFIGGWQMALSYYVAGIPFDALHAFGNTVLTWTLLPVLLRVLPRAAGEARILT